MVPLSEFESERPKPTDFKSVEFTNFSKAANIMAETIGFEPMEAINLVGFQDRFIKPDSDTFPQSCLSTVKLSKIKGKQVAYVIYYIKLFKKVNFKVYKLSFSFLKALKANSLKFPCYLLQVLLEAFCLLQYLHQCYFHF